MSVQAHKCNQKGCDGFILFENADFSYKKSLNKGEYVLDRPTCNKCGKEFKVVISHELIDFNEDKMELNDKLPQCCYTEYEKSLKTKDEMTNKEKQEFQLGDTAYMIDEDYRFFESEVKRISLLDGKYYYETGDVDFEFKDIGDWVFTSQIYREIHMENIFED